MYPRTAFHILNKQQGVRMADRFTPTKMDWTSPGDVHKRFKLFKQKCELIFEGPLCDTEEARKVRLMLLWIDDKGLEIYNTATFDNTKDRLRIDPVFRKLESYCNPQSNQSNHASSNKEK